MIIHLPFPPASLSGHNEGHWKDKARIVAKHREWACEAASGIKVGDFGDILLTVTFIPPNRRGDRVNFPNRMKPYFDGIADALRVNDSRFVPRFFFANSQAPGQVQVQIQNMQEVTQMARPYSSRRVVK